MLLDRTLHVLIICQKMKKKTEHNRILKRNFDHLCTTIPLLKPKSVIPFAGAYVIGGKKL